MYIPLSLTTIFLLFCSSTYVTTLATDPVPRANAAAIENPLINEKTPGSHKRHDRFLSLSNHIAARAGPAPAVEAQDPTTESTDAQSNESESNQPAPAARKQDQDDDDEDDDDDDDDRHETPEKPKHDENDQSGEGGDSDGLETPEHPRPDDNFNSTTTARCGRQSGAGSANCVVSTTRLPTGTAASAVAATTSSSSAPPVASTTATQAIAPSSASSSTNVPTTTAAATGAAAGLDARNLFLVWVRIWGGGAAMTATVFGTFACAVMYISFLL